MTSGKESIICLQINELITDDELVCDLLLIKAHIKT